MTRPGYISSRLAAAMAMYTGCVEYGLIAISAILILLVARQRQRRRGHGIAQKR